MGPLFFAFDFPAHATDLIYDTCLLTCIFTGRIMGNPLAFYVQLIS
jgi:hypothetical protein